MTPWIKIKNKSGESDCPNIRWAAPGYPRETEETSYAAPGGERALKQYDFSRFEEGEIDSDSDDLPNSNDAPEEPLQQTLNNKMGLILNNKKDQYVERISLHRPKNQRSSDLSSFRTPFSGTLTVPIRGPDYMFDQDQYDLEYEQWVESSDAV